MLTLFTERSGNRARLALPGIAGGVASMDGFLQVSLNPCVLPTRAVLCESLHAALC